MKFIKPLHLQDLTRDVGPFRLRASFQIASGEKAALIAPSGFGKTTLLRMIAGLDSVDAGILMLGDLDLYAISPERRNIGFVFQDSALFPSMTLLENVAFGLKMSGVARVDREARALEWLSRIGLSDRAGSDVSILSGGEKQRVALARALIIQPSLLLLDEPFTGLDRGLREQLRTSLKEMLKLWPAPTLMVSHDEADVADIATVRIQGEKSRGADGVEERIFRR